MELSAEGYPCLYVDFKSQEPSFTPIPTSRLGTEPFMHAAALNATIRLLITSSSEVVWLGSRLLRRIESPNRTPKQKHSLLSPWTLSILTLVALHTFEAPKSLASFEETVSLICHFAVMYPALYLLWACIRDFASWRRNQREVR